MTVRTNQNWLDSLADSGTSRDDAITDLSKILSSGLPYALSKWISSSDPRTRPLIEDVVQETILRVLEKMDTFQGKSKFTTWVFTIAVRIALTELRRQRWREVSLDDLVEKDEGIFRPGITIDSKPGPEKLSVQNDLINRVRRIIHQELTEKQSQAMIALVINGMPVAETAERMGMNRNALYKLMHDARKRLKQRMEKEGLTAENVMAVFEAK